MGASENRRKNRATLIVEHMAARCRPIRITGAPGESCPAKEEVTMMRFTLPVLVALVLAPIATRAQEIVVVEIGHIPSLPDKNQTVWGLGGYEMITLRASVGEATPIMRSETMDAR